jgi:MYXO-CTERM domain-containing protein
VKFRILTHAAAATLLAGSAWANPVARYDFEQNLLPTTGAASIAFSGTPNYELSSVGGGSGYALRFAAGEYLTFTNPVGGNGGGTRTNQYTLVMDVRFDAPRNFTSLMQTSLTNNDDGDWFLQDITGPGGGLGISGDYADTGNSTRADTSGIWNRLVLTIDLTDAGTGQNRAHRSYVNGQLQNVVAAPVGWGLDGRFALDSTFFLLRDNSGEVNSGLISTAMLYDRALTADEVLTLGGPQAIPTPSAVALLGVAALTAGRRRR